MMAALACLAAIAAGAGGLLALLGWAAVQARPTQPPPAATDRDDGALPGITVLRPLYGDEPLLEAALLSACRQTYPRFQVVFGIQDPTDRARAVVERVRAQLPDCDIALVCDNTADGANRKVANLINMLPAAKHDVLVIADSDIHADPLYLRAIAAELARPGTGLVTTLYRGLAGNGSLAAALAVTGITHGFLPGAALGRRLGRQDCLGATMALRRDTLAEIGGLAALLDELADDNVLGRRVRARGHRVGLAPTIPATTVPEASIAAVFRHELRWARTIRQAEPGAFPFSALQYPLAWAILALVLSGGEEWGWAVALAVWTLRGVAALGIDAALARGHSTAPNRAPDCARLFLLPLRDLMSVAVWLAAFAGTRVEWRGRVLDVRRGPAALPGDYALVPGEHGEGIDWP